MTEQDEERRLQELQLAFLRLPYGDVLNSCLGDGNAHAICANPRLWLWFLERDFGLSNNPDLCSHPMEIARRIIARSFKWLVPEEARTETSDGEMLLDFSHTESISRLWKLYDRLYRSTVARTLQNPFQPQIVPRGYDHGMLLCAVPFSWNHEDEEENSDSIGFASVITFLFAPEIDIFIRLFDTRERWVPSAKAENLWRTGAIVNRSTNYAIGPTRLAQFTFSLTALQIADYNNLLITIQPQTVRARDFLGYVIGGLDRQSNQTVIGLLEVTEDNATPVLTHIVVPPFLGAYTPSVMRCAVIGRKLYIMLRYAGMTDTTIIGASLAETDSRPSFAPFAQFKTTEVLGRTPNEFGVTADGSALIFAEQYGDEMGFQQFLSIRRWPLHETEIAGRPEIVSLPLTPFASSTDPRSLILYNNELVVDIDPLEIFRRKEICVVFVTSGIPMTLRCVLVAAKIELEKYFFGATRPPAKIDYALTNTLVGTISNVSIGSAERLGYQEWP